MKLKKYEFKKRGKKKLASSCEFLALCRGSIMFWKKQEELDTWIINLTICIQ
jgi:hypothetical protein